MTRLKRALEKDGWTITGENLQLPFGGTQTYIDIAADKIFAAEKAGRKIAVEVKSFVGKSNLTDFEKAVGQFVIYRFAMKREDPERKLFVNPGVIELIETEELGILVFDEAKEVIVRWIN